MHETKVSFVIPVRVGIYPSIAVESIRSVNYPKEQIEIIIAEGNQPSAQRNEAVRRASGDVIYFIDDDSAVHAEAVTEGLSFLARQDVAVVGGPALTYQEGGFLQQCFGEVVGAYWGGFITRFRHRSIGDPRPVRGEELILCNLMMKKESFMASNGFNANLYPGEDPELMKRMRSAPSLIYYNPRMVVYRPRRRNTIEFIRQNFDYSYGRARHIFRQFRSKDFLFFLPSAFTLYLVGLLIFPNPLLLIPLFIYLSLVAGNSFLIAAKRRSVASFFLLVPHFFLQHISYGIGLITGLVRCIWQQKKTTTAVRLTVIPVIGD